MAFAARDPYYLAVFGEELHKNPSYKDLLDQTCTRCHAPAGSVEHEQSGGHMTFDEMVSGTTTEANLGRDGVTCSLCHQIADQGLGKSASFSGGFTVGYDRKIFGPHSGPNTNPMQLIINYTPTAATHVTTSELCATCHTVVVPIMKGDQHVGDFLEQAPYMEWLNSSSSPGKPCGSCHLPTQDPTTMADLASPIAKYPNGLSARKPYGKHRFSGGNSYMLRILEDNLSWTGTDIPAAELEEAAVFAEEHVTEGGTISILSAKLDGSALAVEVQIDNHTGHKLPTGYPGRRMWIHLRAEGQSGETLFESGAFDSRGALVSPGGLSLDDPKKVMPHRDLISADTEVAVYEAIAIDDAGAPTHLPFASRGFVKDNRILPQGWSETSTWIDWIRPKGVGSDASFSPGYDRVSYQIPQGSAVKRVSVELLYQTVRPAELDALTKVPDAAAVRFSQMASARAPLPTLMSKASIDL